MPEQAHPTTYNLLREYLEPTDGSVPSITHSDGIMLWGSLGPDTQKSLIANGMGNALNPGNPWRGTGFAGAVGRTNIAM